MAGAKSGVHVVQLKPISVPKELQDGNKFIRWDDDSTVGTPVTLRVDVKGFFLYWTDQNKETDLLEISTIRDTRTGKSAKVPREGKLRDSVTMGAQDVPLEDKTVTVVHGADMVNVSFANFCCNNRETAQLWTDALLKMAYNLLALNAPAITFLEKAYYKILLMTDRDGKIPVKTIVKKYAQHKDDKKRVEKALVECGLPIGKNDSFHPEKFTFEVFFNFYRHLVSRHEVDKIYEQLFGGNKKKGMTVDQLVEFLNKEQRDPRLNEILYPYANPARAKDIIKQYEPNKSFAQKGLLSLDGFLMYLMSEDNSIISPEKLDLNMDMDQPLSHYFINSSHNTYLTGHQLTGKSSVEIYRQCLLAGCRCVELDCWNGKNSDEEPIITHGFTVVTEVVLKDVLEAIAECAFKTSDYPVILSFENHCSPKQQAKMAMYCRKLFGDKLLTECLNTHQLKPGQLLPSANQLSRKIIIKNKKKHYPRAAQSGAAEVSSGRDSDSSSLPPPTPDKAKPTITPTTSEEGQNDPGGGLPDEKGFINSETVVKPLSCDMEESDTDVCSDEEEDEEVSQERPEAGDQNEGTAAKESEAGAEMSALVNYVQPVRFHSFEYAERRNKSYEVSSFVETQATNLLKEHPVEFVNYNKRQLSRIYPKGTRVDSSNYMPQVFWNAGCQMVALNYQTLDLGMQLNLGIFEFNARSGLLLKPDFMRRQDRKFDPFTESTVDGIIAGTVSIKILSAQFLTDKRVGTYVEVDMYGLPADTVRRRFRTKTVPANGINPVYDEEPFVFKKVVLPELACLRISVSDDNGRFLGHRILPVVGLRPGYRHISLRNEAGQPLTLPTLFVHIMVKDYIPDGLSELADALANPIAYQSMVEKHATQLKALTDDIDEDVEESKPLVAPTHAKVETSKSEEKLRLTTLPEDCQPVSPALKQSSLNGNIPRSMSTGSTSPIPAPSRQDSGNKKLNQSVRSISDDNTQDKVLTLLESPEAEVKAEPLEKIKEHKVVQKVMSKLDRDLQILKKKHEKLKEKEREVLHNKEDKLIRLHEQQKLNGGKTSNKFVRRFSGPQMQLLKRRSDVDPQVLTPESRAKLEDLRKSHSQSLYSLSKECLQAELEISQKYQEPLFGAMEKAMQLSQAAQVDYLKALHDREVSNLMKRVEAETKEEMKNLSRKYKDKNELARRKRELHQKLIDSAVAERQRFSSLLNKRIAELTHQHSDIKDLLEEQRAAAEEKLAQEFDSKCALLLQEFEKNPLIFLSNEDASENTKL